jgi:hypothetical protein
MLKRWVARIAATSIGTMARCPIGFEPRTSTASMPLWVCSHAGKAGGEPSSLGHR